MMLFFYYTTSMFLLCLHKYVFHPLTGLPSCVDPENVTPIPAEVSSVDPDQKEPGNPPSKAARIQFEDIFAVALFAMFLQYFIS